MQFTFRLMENWPRLAWLARLAPSEETIVVDHGPWVETTGQWFCEAIWCGDFAQGDFDRSDRIFGSGGRIRGDRVMFVSASHTMDRLIWAQKDGIWHISNSLPCVLNCIGAGIDPTDRSFQKRIGTIALGIDDYTRELPTSAGPVRLACFHNVVWDGQKLAEQEKPETTPPLTCFDDYRGFMRDSMRELAANLSDKQRRFPFKMLGTMSSGYDSACVSTIAHEAGLRRVISMAKSKSGKADTGKPVADALGLELVVIDREAYRAKSMPEVPFVASDAKGEDIYFAGAEQELAGTALLTGFTGDLQWSTVYDEHHRGPRCRRGDRAGLSLTEYRVRAGFIHCPIPMLGGLHQAQIIRISHSEEMKPWDTGGDYSRPIARRILEEAGVPRGSFAREKMATSVLLAEHRNLLSPSTARDFKYWLDDHAAEFWCKGKVPPRLHEAILAPAQWIARRGWAVYARTKSLPRSLGFIRTMSRQMAEWGDKERLSWFLFPWAIERAKVAYADSHHETKPGPSGPGSDSPHKKDTRALKGTALSAA